jgi:hypothetical protein
LILMFRWTCSMVSRLSGNQHCERWMNFKLSSLDYMRSPVKHPSVVDFSAPLLLPPITKSLTRSIVQFQIGTLAINRFKIAQSFPRDKKDASYGEIVQTCSLSEPVIRRILRSAMTRYVFRESRPGFVEHTAISKRLATDSALQDALSVIDKEDWPLASRVRKMFPDRQQALR